MPLRGSGGLLGAALSAGSDACRAGPLVSGGVKAGHCALLHRLRCSAFAQHVCCPGSDSRQQPISVQAHDDLLYSSLWPNRVLSPQSDVDSPAPMLQVVLFDVQQRSSIAELSTPFIKYVVWSTDMSAVALLSKHAIIIANKKLGNSCTGEGPCHLVWI